MVMNVYSVETDKQISPPSILFISTTCTLGIYVFTNLPFHGGEICPSDVNMQKGYWKPSQPL